MGKFLKTDRPEAVELVTRLSEDVLAPARECFEKRGATLDSYINFVMGTLSSEGKITNEFTAGSVTNLLVLTAMYLEKEDECKELKRQVSLLSD